MSNQKIRIWGRVFTLPVLYDAFDDEIVTEEQKKALAQFLTVPDVGGKDMVIRYCLQQNPEEIKQPVTNIFCFVMPTAIYVCRKGGNVALLCEYKYDPENGIAVVYHNGKMQKVGTQDLVL